MEDDATIFVNCWQAGAHLSLIVVDVFGVCVCGELDCDLAPRVRQIGASLQVGDIHLAVYFNYSVKCSCVFFAVMNHDRLDVVRQDVNTVLGECCGVGVDVGL